MRLDGRPLVAGMALSMALGSAWGATTNAFTRAVSFSGQIHVLCAEPALAAPLVSFCEDIRAKLVKRVGDDGPWRAPVAVVVRQRAAGSPVAMPGEAGRLRSSVVTVSGFLRFQIEMEAPPPVDADEFVRALAGALLSEMANRSLGKVAPGQTMGRVPAWLVWGLVNRMDDTARPATLREVRRAVEQGALPGYSEFTAWDAPQCDTALYRACCELLVEALETQLKGREKLRDFVFGLKPGRSWGTTLAETFGGGFGYKPGLEKWWALFASRASAMIVAEGLSWTESRRQLEMALRTDEPALAAGLSTGVLPADFLKQCANDANTLMEWLVPVQGRLLTMAPLAHPLYRPVAGAYLNAIDSLREKQPPQKGFWAGVTSWFAEVGGAREKRIRRFQSDLQRAVAARRRAEQSGEAMSRYVGEVEASVYPEDFAKQFGGWFQVNPPAGGSPQPTPISKFLDRVEAEQRR